MKKLFTLLTAVILLVGVSATRVRAQDPQLEDMGFNLNGTTDDFGTDLGNSVALGTEINGVAGATMNTSGLALDPSDTFLSGLGSVSLVYNPNPSSATSYFLDAFVEEAAGSPSFNEYTGSGGSLAAGESWETGYVPVCTTLLQCGMEGLSLGDPNGTNPSVYTDVFNGGASDNGNLANSNGLLSGSSNYLEGCLTEPGCNGYGIVALGQTFSLTSGEEEILTLTGSLTAPGSGFYVTEVNPIDGENSNCSTFATNGGCPTTVYYSLSASEQPSGTQPPPPGNTPEPSSWILVASGLGMGIKRLRGRFSFKTMSKAFAAVLALVALVAAPMAKAQTVYTVPWVPGTSAAHTAAAGTSIVLAAVFIPGSGESTTASNYTYQWSYGDGSPAGPLTTATYLNDLEGSHTYPTSGSVVNVTTWTATVTVTDKTTSNQYQATYPVIWEDVNVLQTRVNIAIDWGLWYLHKTEYHPTATSGNWHQGCGDGLSDTCGNNFVSLTATNVQAFEVNGHLASGPSGDPYTSDVAEGLDDLFYYITASSAPATTAKDYYFDPSVATFDCVNASNQTTYPTDTNSGGARGWCAAGSTMAFYNSGATSCPGATYTSSGYQNPCVFAAGYFDSNHNGYGDYANTYNDAGYEQGPVIDAIVASGAPSTVVPATNLQGNANPAHVAGQTYLTVVQDMADYINYCQYGQDTDVGGGPQWGADGYVRGGGYSSQGGGWLYSCLSGDDDSTSQWEAIGLISAYRAPGFSVSIPKIVTDAAQTWVTNAEAAESMSGIGVNDWQNAGATYGGFGYRGDLDQSNEWGPWAVTPSGMVQMSLTGVGRTPNQAAFNSTYGDTTTSPDQRFNNVETFYADNFCNNYSSSAYYYDPKGYTYGLYSFTKSMLLHNPGGALSPIQYLRTQTPGVFSPTSSPIPNTIDWYAAVATTHYNGGDACDGVAQTLVGRQNYNGVNGLWYGDNYGDGQDNYETAWSLIMLNRTVFIQCVDNLTGSGTKGAGLIAAKADLSWSGIPNVSGYNVYRSTTNGGPYTQVSYQGGTTQATSFSDRTGLKNGVTYYYVIDPITSSGATVCQSNQATIVVP